MYGACIEHRYNTGEPVPKETGARPVHRPLSFVAHLGFIEGGAADPLRATKMTFGSGVQPGGLRATALSAATTIGPTARGNLHPGELQNTAARQCVVYKRMRKQARTERPGNGT